jgi:hypothetical protein
MLTRHLRETEKDGSLFGGSEWQIGACRVVSVRSLGLAVLHLSGTLTKWGTEYLPEPKKLE